MKRDFDLIRSILLDIENKDLSDEHLLSYKTPIRTEVVNYNLHLMQEHELVSGNFINSGGKTPTCVSKLPMNERSE